LYLINGRVSRGRDNPILGCDASGEVVAVGDKVTKFKVGDKVITSDYAMWHDGLLTPEKEATGLDLSLGTDGCLRELFTINENALVRMPKNLNWDEAGVIYCTWVTAWNAVINKGEIRPGQTILILGTGGVSVASLLFAKAAGARVIITEINDEILAKAKELGADECINFTENPEWHEKVLVLTGGKGVDVRLRPLGMPRSTRHYYVQSKTEL